MKFNVDNIQIFIMTHNRSNLLKETLLSILNQTAKINEITVLDNESTDNTEQIVKEFAFNGVKYIKTYGFLGNFNKAKETANKEYIMLLHDDDILHPEYIETAVKLLNKHDNVSLITTRYTEFSNSNPDMQKNISKKYYLFKNQKDFATYMYFLEHIAYAPAIYKTKNFIDIPLEYDKYSKFNDWPFMVKAANYGNVILFDDKKMFYVRRHEKQDTWTYTNIPSLEQIVNWDRCFYDAMKIHNKFSIKYLMFKIKCENFMTGKYKSFLSEEQKKTLVLNELIETSNRLNPYKLSIYQSLLFKLCKKFKIMSFFNKYKIYQYAVFKLQSL